MKPGMTVTDYVEGPFVVIVTDPDKLDHLAFPQVMAPLGGYPDKESAMRDIDSFAARKTPYLGLHFSIVPMRTPESFGRFCSWED